MDDRGVRADRAGPTGSVTLVTGRGQPAWSDTVQCAQAARNPPDARAYRNIARRWTVFCHQGLSQKLLSLCASYRACTVYEYYHIPGSSVVSEEFDQTKTRWGGSTLYTLIPKE